MSLFLDEAIQERFKDPAFRRHHYAYLSDAAFDLIELIGRGGRILRRHGVGTIDMVDLPAPRHPRNPDGRAMEPLRRPLAINLASFRELLRHGLISKLTEKTENHRTGWSDMGLSGKPGMEFYLCTQ